MSIKNKQSKKTNHITHVNDSVTVPLVQIKPQ